MKNNTYIFLLEHRQTTITKKWLLLLVVVLSSQLLSSHGTVTSPPSRVYNCYLENPENPTSAACIDAVSSHGSQALYDWNEINQGEANGDHMSYVFNGNLPSGGRPDKYGGMDQVRQDWVTTPVTAGPLTVTWTNTAPHETAYYEVYITTEDWTPDQMLTWESLELLVRTDPSGPESTVDIDIILPERQGKHVLYSIWQRSDSPEAFYSTSDLDFGGTLSVNDILAPIQSVIVYPNPIDDTATITYTLPKEQTVSVKVYDLSGREIATLVNETQAAQSHNLQFSKGSLNGGIYFCVIKAGNYLKSIKLVLK